MMDDHDLTYRRFPYRAHVKPGLHFFILFMCGSMAASVYFAWQVDPRPDPDPLTSLVVPLVLAVVAGVLTWRATSVWTTQQVILRADAVEYHIGGQVRIVRFDEARSFTFLALPFWGGRATLHSATTSVRLYSNVKGITSLLTAVRQGLRDAGTDTGVDEARYRSFLKTATFAEQRAERYRLRYDAFPWLAMLSPVLVLAVSHLAPLTLGARLLWTAVFAMYPWFVAGLIELRFLADFLHRMTPAGFDPTGHDTANPDPSATLPLPPDPPTERRVLRRGALAGYYAYLAINVLMLVRLV